MGLGRKAPRRFVAGSVLSAVKLVLVVQVRCLGVEIVAVVTSRGGCAGQGLG